jgi:hypothetical protein
MADGMTIEDLKKLRKNQEPVDGMTRFEEVTTNEYRIVGFLIDIIEAQEARIKALEDRLDLLDFEGSSIRLD